MDLIVLLLVCFTPVVWCYSSGQVTASCDDMTPQHRASAQTGSAPYTVTVDRSTYKLGDKVTVQLQRTGSSSFSGFLLKATAVGSQIAVGSFSLSSANTQLLTCSQKSNSAVSHTSSSSKSSIQATWTPDASGSATSIQFSATFVQTKSTFWVAVQSPVLTFTGDSTGGSAGASTAPTTTTSTTMSVNAPINISNADCGVTKTCFSQPSNCDPSASSDCYFMSAMMLSTSSGAVHYEMTGPSNGYIAFGFSDDQIMGKDDIYICGISSNSLPTLQHAYTTGKTTPEIISLGDVSDLTATMKNNMISCSFTTTNTISTQRSISSNQAYYILFAYGPSSNGQIQFHTDTFTSADKVDLTKVQLLAAKSETPAVVKAHGALMLIAWMTTGTLGMMVARYMKGMAKEHKTFDKDLWFVVHVPVMCLTVAATIIAFIIIFVYGQGWAGGAHPVLGCLVMILSFIQPIIAFMRCGPQHPTRYVFNWTHSLNALAIKILAVAAIFTGLELIDGSSSLWMVKTMSGFTAWECLFYIFMEAHFRWKIHTSDTMESRMTNVDSLLVGVFFLGNFAFLVALLVGIGTATVVP